MSNRKHSNGIVATTLAIGLGLVSSSALAMTSTADVTVPANDDRAHVIVDGQGAIVVANPNHGDGRVQVAENLIGGKVGPLPVPTVN